MPPAMAVTLQQEAFFSLKIDVERGAQAGFSCSLAVCLRRMPMLCLIWLQSNGRGQADLLVHDDQSHPGSVNKLQVNMARKKRV